MKVRLGGNEFEATSVSISKEMADLLTDYPGMEMPEAVWTGTLEVDIDVMRKLLARKARTLTLHIDLEEDMFLWQYVPTSLVIDFLDTKWQIFRRDYKLNRVYLKELLAN